MPDGGTAIAAKPCAAGTAPKAFERAGEEETVAALALTEYAGESDAAGETSTRAAEEAPEVGRSCGWPLRAREAVCDANSSAVADAVAEEELPMPARRAADSEESTLRRSSQTAEVAAGGLAEPRRLPLLPSSSDSYPSNVRHS